MKILLENYQAVIEIDDSDLPEFSAYRWRVHKNKRYVSRRGSDGSTIMLHRQLMNAAAGLVVDHIDRNPLNNTRANLRVVTQQQNTWNKAIQGETVGVYKRAHKWHATIRLSGKSLGLGVFGSKDDAIAARDIACRILRGESAMLNSPSSDLTGLPVHFFAPTARKLLLSAMSE